MENVECNNLVIKGVTHVPKERMVGPMPTLSQHTFVGIQIKKSIFLKKYT